MARESFEQLKDAVTKATNVKQAAIVLINKMGDRLAEMAQHQPTPQELQELAAELRQHAEALAEAVSEHED